MGFLAVLALTAIACDDSQPKEVIVTREVVREVPQTVVVKEEIIVEATSPLKERVIVVDSEGKECPVEVVKTVWTEVPYGEDMTEAERDALLLRLEAGQNEILGRLDRLEAGQASLQSELRYLTAYVKAMGDELLPPAQIKAIEAEVSESESVAAD